MSSNFIYTIILFFLFHSLQAQQSVRENEIKKIYELIKYNNFGVAQHKIDSLRTVLDKTKVSKKTTKDRVEVDYLQCLIWDRKDLPLREIVPTLLQIKDKADAEGYFVLSYKISLLLALSYEKGGEYQIANTYLDKAFELYKEYHLEDLYSTYCIRRSSYYRMVEDYEAMKVFADLAKKYAQKYGNITDVVDSHILLSFYASKKNNWSEHLKHAFILRGYYYQFNDSTALLLNYNSIAKAFCRMQNFDTALKYNDSSKRFLKEVTNLEYDYSIHKTRYEIFEVMGNVDSAHYYFKKYHEQFLKSNHEFEKAKIKELEDRYQHDKKEAVIKSKNQQIQFVITILIIIILMSILIVRKNKKISSQNKIISKQLVEITKTLDQKKVLLSELQHRVKNHLQNVISILEIQKESFEFNNVEEVIRENKNRIQSMALLHEKLSVSEAVDSINFGEYIKEVCKLVKGSYEFHNRRVLIKSLSEIDKIPIQKALPIGLILVELISNSIKHAFDGKNLGIIDIEVKFDENTGKNVLCYTDTGRGFEFGKSNEKGLGMEIIKGLLEQLNAQIDYNNNNGFELKIYF